MLQDIHMCVVQELALKKARAPCCLVSVLNS
jgi:hypothetical protein